MQMQNATGMRNRQATVGKVKSHCKKKQAMKTK